MSDAQRPSDETTHTPLATHEIELGDVRLTPPSSPRGRPLSPLTPTTPGVSSFNREVDAFLDKHEDALWTELLRGDPDASIQDDFCMTYGPHLPNSFPSFPLAETLSLRISSPSISENVSPPQISGAWLGSGRVQRGDL